VSGKEDREPGTGNRQPEATAGRAGSSSPPPLAEGFSPPIAPEPPPFAPLREGGQGGSLEATSVDGEPSAHRRFRFERLSGTSVGRVDRNGIFAITYGAPPRKNADGSTSISLRIPVVIASNCLGEAEKNLSAIADILEAHWPAEGAAS
jgi:hypothetical protein